MMMAAAASFVAIFHDGVKTGADFFGLLLMLTLSVVDAGWLDGRVRKSLQRFTVQFVCSTAAAAAGADYV